MVGQLASPACASLSWQFNVVSKRGTCIILAQTHHYYGNSEKACSRLESTGGQGGAISPIGVSGRIYQGLRGGVRAPTGVGLTRGGSSGEEILSAGPEGIMGPLNEVSVDDPLRIARRETDVSDSGELSWKSLRRL